MHFAVSHIRFDFELEKDPRQYEAVNLELRRLADKIRKNFKVAAAANIDESHGMPRGIVIAALATREEALSKLLDKIVTMCEESGIARVVDEETLVEHIDILENQDQI